MKRTLAALTLLFGHHWSLALMSGTAVLSIGVGVFTFMAPRFVLGNIFSLFAILYASTSFRQFASNGRLSLVPGFRIHAVGALFLVAVGIGVAGALAAALDREPATGVLGTALLAFALFSAYGLVGQWLSTTRAPVLLQLLMVVLTVRYVSDGDVYAGAFGRHAWILAVAAFLGWAWLFMSVRGTIPLAAPHPMLRIEQSSGVRPAQFTFGAIFGIGPLDFGRPTHSAGTLMRGSNDGWVNRIGDLLFWVVGIALVWMLTIYGIAASSDWRPRPESDPVLGFLLLSFASTAFQAPNRYFDWPARLRYVWLRTPGGRAALWRMLEWTIVTEAAIVVAITASVSVVLFKAADTPVRLSLTYVLGCAAVALLGAYGAMGVRVAGATVVAVNIAAVLGLVPMVMILREAGPQPAVVYSLLFVIVVLAVIARFVTRRMFLRMDWCAVKPQRDPLASARS